VTFSRAEDERDEKIDRRTELNEKKESGKKAEAEACDIYRRSNEDIPPEPGNPNFWPSASLHIEEDLEPPSRNKPDSSPWCEVQETEGASEAKEGQRPKQSPKIEEPEGSEE
jgi:hypothetical protein